MSILIGSAGIIMLFIALYAGAKKVESMEMERVQIEKTINQSQMLGRMMEEKIARIRRYRHDLKGLLDTVSYLQDAGREKTRDMSGLTGAGEMPRTADAGYCADPLVDAILRRKEEQCTEKGIPFSCTADSSGSGCSALSSEDKASILQNLLSNAEEASLVLPDGSERGMTVQIKDAENFSLCVRNRIEKGKPVFFRSRKDPGMHGIGLQVVRKIVQDAGGQMDILPDTVNGWLTVQIDVG